MDVEQVIDCLDELSNDASIPKNVRSSLLKIKLSLNCSEEEIPLRVDAALHLLEELASDPNISPFGRTEIWNLTSAVEELNSQ